MPYGSVAATARRRCRGLLWRRSHDGVRPTELRRGDLVVSESLDVFDTTLPFDPIRVGPIGAAARRLEEAKADLLTRALDTGGGAQHGPGLEHLVRRYYRHTAPEDLLGRDPVDVLGAVVSHRRAAQNRPQGTAVVHAFTPSVEGHGWSAGHTVIEIVTDDMPFLVDSVTASLGVQGRAIHLVVHPQFVVRRDVAGALHEVDRRRRRARACPRARSSSRGCTSRSTGRPTRPP